MEINQYILKKEVDWSLLHEGFSIPIMLQVPFYENMKHFLKRGETRSITLLVEGLPYQVTIKNQKFDEDKWKGHKDIVQVRYSPQSELTKKLQDVFSTSFGKIIELRSKRLNTKGYAQLEESEKEYLALFATQIEDTFAVECITNDDVRAYQDELVESTEDEVEALLNRRDEQASWVSQSKVIKIRRVNQSIISSLKIFYQYKCQICEQSFRPKYDVDLVEAHHIEEFIKSQNNDPDNLLVICPNHHRIIHMAIPTFDRERLLFRYQNGFEERITLNKHL